MIYKRVAARLRAQDWVAITIEVGIVIVGVFVGTQVSNWNAARLERAQTQRMLVQLSPQLNDFKDYMSAAHRYFSVTRGYSTVALAGWHNDPKVTDRDFVIAAYQASQVYGFGANGTAWASVLGSDRLRDINDGEMRTELAYLASSDYSNINEAAVDTPYRSNVRRVIPIGIQDAIRDHCGDRFEPNRPAVVSLPRRCAIELLPAEAHAAAATLRAHPDLAQDLQWQMAAVDAFDENLRPFEYATRTLLKDIAQGRS
jgi:hypothetical protein